MVGISQFDPNRSQAILRSSFRRTGGRGTCLIGQGAPTTSNPQNPVLVVVVRVVRDLRKFCKERFFEKAGSPPHFGKQQISPTKTFRFPKTPTTTTTLTTPGILRLSGLRDPDQLPQSG